MTVSAWIKRGTDHNYVDVTGGISKLTYGNFNEYITVKVFSSERPSILLN